MAIKKTKAEIKTEIIKLKRNKNGNAETEIRN
jgi:hypothetical protein